MRELQAVSPCTSVQGQHLWQRSKCHDQDQLAVSFSRAKLCCRGCTAHVMGGTHKVGSATWGALPVENSAA